MNCSEAQQALEAQSDPAKSGPLDAAVAAHVESCAACAAYAKRMDRDDALLTEALAGKPVDRPLADHRRSVAGKVAAFESRRGWARRFWVSTAAAAMLALTAWGVANFVRPQNREVAEAPTKPKPGVEQPVEMTLDAAALAARVAKLQETVRDKQVLDELEQLQQTFENAGDGEAKSLTEDAELYVERILALDTHDPEQMREILTGIHSAGITSRFEKLRESISDDAPAPLQDSLKLAAATLAEASELGNQPGVSHAN